jgi:hypothetical protein
MWATAKFSHNQLMSRVTGALKWPVAKQKTALLDEQIYRFWGLLSRGDVDVEDFILGVACVPTGTFEDEILGADFLPADLNGRTVLISSAETLPEEEEAHRRAEATVKAIKKRRGRTEPAAHGREGNFKKKPKVGLRCVHT